MRPTDPIVATVANHIFKIRLFIERANSTISLNRIMVAAFGCAALLETRIDLIPSIGVFRNLKHKQGHETIFVWIL